MADPRQEEQNQINGVQAATGVAGIGLGAHQVVNSKDRLLGRKKVYHGTHKKDVDAIKEQGLKPSFGGTGFSSDSMNTEEIDLSKNQVHVSSYKDVADSHANRRGLTPFEVKMLNIKNNAGLKGDPNPNAHTFGINMDYRKWKGMDADSQVIDPDTNHLVGLKRPMEMPVGMVQNNPQGFEQQLFQHMNKQVASKGDVDILPSELLGNGMENRLQRYKDTARNLPDYIKKHPGRFGLGLGGTAVGAGLIGKGVHDLRESTQQKEANEMEYGLLKLASIKGEEVRNHLRNEGRPVDAHHMADYIDRESDDAGFAGMVLGGTAGALGAGAYSNAKQTKTKYVAEDAIDMAQAEYELAKGNVERSYKGMLNGQNSPADYNDAIDYFENIKNTIKERSAELQGMQSNMSKYDVANAVEKGDTKVIGQLLRQPKALMRGGLYGGLIGGGTAAAAAGAHALNEAAPEMGMEDHDIVTHNAPLGETVGTAVGGVGGLAAGHALRGKMPFGSLGRVVGTTVGMGLGAGIGHGVQNAARGNYSFGDEEE